MENPLMSIGLKSMIDKMIPFAAVKLFSSFNQVEDSEIEDFFHIFVSATLALEHSEFFEQRRQKTILLTSGTQHAQLMEGFHQLNITQPYEELSEALQSLHRHAHHPPVKVEEGKDEKLSPREIEVVRLLVEGLINKEIAERLNIGLTTVITHRKNIFEKLGVRSLAGLTIYAIMKRYVEI